MMIARLLRQAAIAVGAVVAFAGLGAGPASAQLFWDWGGGNMVGGSGREVVRFSPKFAKGEVIVSFSDRRLYYITKPGEAFSYPIASPGRVMKYSRRSPKLTMICPLGNCGLKRTTSRPLPSTMLPPPQSQNSCADAGATWKQLAATTAPAAKAARRNARPMIISQLLVSLPCPSNSTVHTAPLM
jgi:hypothetical protein